MHVATSYTVSIGKHCSISVTWQSAGPLALFFIFFPCAQAPVDCNLYSSSLESNQTVSSESLMTDPLGLHLRRLDFIAVTVFAVCFYFFRPSVSALAGPPTDPELWHHGPLHNLASGTGPWRQIVFGLLMLSSAVLSIPRDPCTEPQPPFP